MNKRGLSDVVTTLLIILVAVAAVAIIGTVVLKNVRESGSQIEAGTSNVRLSIDGVNTAVNPGLKYARIVVKREVGEGSLDSMRVILQDSSGKSFVKDLTQTIAPLESKAIDFYYSDIGEVTKISVYPLFKDNKGKEVIGKESQAGVIGSTNSQTPISSTLSDNQPVLPSGLVAYWRFEESSGSAAKDELGKTPLEVKNLVNRVPGKVGKAVEMDKSLSVGCASQNAGIINKEDLSDEIKNLPQGSYSISWWNSLSKNEGLTRINLATDFSAPSGCGQCGRWFRLGDILIRNKNSVDDSSADISFTPPTINEWHHFAYYFDKTSLKEGLYIDGNLVQEKNLPVGDYGKINWVSIGVYHPGCVDSIPEEKIDEVMLFNKALTADEIKNIYDSQNSVAAPTFSFVSLINPETWQVGTTGSQPGFNAIGDADTENAIEMGTGPFGDDVVLWKAGNDAASDADGGWNGEAFNIDHTKTYRYSVWIKKTGVISGTTYLGLKGGVVTFLTSPTIEGNPYFWCGNLPALDKWYLVVGYVHGSGTSSTQHLGGIYDGQTGEKVVSVSGSDNCNTDFKSTTSAVTQYHRAYLYYDTITTNRQYFYAPRVDLVDGSEPSINALLGK